MRSRSRIEAEVRRSLRDDVPGSFRDGYVESLRSCLWDGVSEREVRSFVVVLRHGLTVRAARREDRGLRREGALAGYSWVLEDDVVV